MNEYQKEAIAKADAELQNVVLPAYGELVKVLEKLAFIAETVAHLRGLEHEILPTTDAARAVIAKAKGE